MKKSPYITTCPWSAKSGYREPEEYEVTFTELFHHLTFGIFKKILNWLSISDEELEEDWLNRQW